MLDLSSDDEEAGGALYMVEPDKRTCSYYFKKLDYEILRPLLIHNYVREVMHRQDDYVEMIINDGNILGQVYGQLDFRIQESETQEVLLDRVTQAVQEVAKEIQMQHNKRGREAWDTMSPIHREERKANYRSLVEQDVRKSADLLGAGKPTRTLLSCEPSLDGEGQDAPVQQHVSNRRASSARFAKVLAHEQSEQ